MEKAYGWDPLHVSRIVTTCPLLANSNDFRTQAACSPSGKLLAALNYFGGIDWYELTPLTPDHPAVSVGRDESAIFEGALPVSLAFHGEDDLVIGNVAKEFLVLKRPNRDPKALHSSCTGCRLSAPEGFIGNSTSYRIHNLTLNHYCNLPYSKLHGALYRQRKKTSRAHLLFIDFGKC